MRDHICLQISQIFVVFAVAAATAPAWLVIVYFIYIHVTSSEQHFLSRGRWDDVRNNFNTFINMRLKPLGSSICKYFKMFIVINQQR
jgi:hypothetical protein